MASGEGRPVTRRRFLRHTSAWSHRVFDPKSLLAMVAKEPSASQRAGLLPADEAAVCKMKLFGQRVLAEVHAAQVTEAVVVLLNAVEQTALKSKTMPFRQSIQQEGLSDGVRGSPEETATAMADLGALLPSADALRAELGMPGGLNRFVLTRTKPWLEKRALLPHTPDDWRVLSAFARTIFPVEFE